MMPWSGSCAPRSRLRDRPSRARHATGGGRYRPGAAIRRVLADLQRPRLTGLGHIRTPVVSPRGDHPESARPARRRRVLRRLLGPRRPDPGDAFLSIRLMHDDSAEITFGRAVRRVLAFDPGSPAARPGIPRHPARPPQTGMARSKAGDGGDLRHGRARCTACRQHVGVGSGCSPPPPPRPLLS